MADEKVSAKAPTPPRMETVRSPNGFAEIYSNFVETNWTLVDVRIKFSQIIPPTKEQAERVDWVLEERAAATLAWGHAKYLHTVLGDLLAKYEKVNGELKTVTLP